ncbi:hypothetical protein IWQ61_009151 [Dispira simplex]|nr:hypothetical protein IWQ61_009151 [Dispira simplex]
MVYFPLYARATVWHPPATGGADALPPRLNEQPTSPDFSEAQRLLRHLLLNVQPTAMVTSPMSCAVSSDGERSFSLVLGLHNGHLLQWTIVTKTTGSIWSGIRLRRIIQAHSEPVRLLQVLHFPTDQPGPREWTVLSISHAGHARLSSLTDGQSLRYTPSLFPFGTPTTLATVSDTVYLEHPSVGFVGGHSPLVVVVDLWTLERVCTWRTRCDPNWVTALGCSSLPSPSHPLVDIFCCTASGTLEWWQVNLSLLLGKSRDPTSSHLWTQVLSGDSKPFFPDASTSFPLLETTAFSRKTRGRKALGDRIIQIRAGPHAADGVTLVTVARKQTTLWRFYSSGALTEVARWTIPLADLGVFQDAIVTPNSHRVILWDQLGNLQTYQWTDAASPLSITHRTGGQDSANSLGRSVWTTPLYVSHHLDHGPPWLVMWANHPHSPPTLRGYDLTLLPDASLPGQLLWNSSNGPCPSLVIPQTLHSSGPSTNESRNDLSPQLQPPGKSLALPEVSTTHSMSESFDPRGRLRKANSPCNLGLLSLPGLSSTVSAPHSASLDFLKVKGEIGASRPLGKSVGLRVSLTGRPDHPTPNGTNTSVTHTLRELLGDYRSEDSQPLEVNRVSNIRDRTPISKTIVSASFDRTLATGAVVHSRMGQSNPGITTLMQSALSVSSSPVLQVHRDTLTDNIPELAQRLLQTGQTGRRSSADTYRSPILRESSSPAYSPSHSDNDSQAAYRAGYTPPCFTAPIQIWSLPSGLRNRQTQMLVGDCWPPSNPIASKVLDIDSITPSAVIVSDSGYVLAGLTSGDVLAQPLLDYLQARSSTGEKSVTQQPGEIRAILFNGHPPSPVPLSPRIPLTCLTLWHPSIPPPLSDTPTRALVSPYLIAGDQKGRLRIWRVPSLTWAAAGQTFPTTCIMQGGQEYPVPAVPLAVELCITTTAIRYISPLGPEILREAVPTSLSLRSAFQRFLTTLWGLALTHADLTTPEPYHQLTGARRNFNHTGHWDPSKHAHFFKRKRWPTIVGNGHQRVCKGSSPTRQVTETILPNELPLLSSRLTRSTLTVPQGSLSLPGTPRKGTRTVSKYPTVQRSTQPIGATSLSDNESPSRRASRKSYRSFSTATSSSASGDGTANPNASQLANLFQELERIRLVHHLGLDQALQGLWLEGVLQHLAPYVVMTATNGVTGLICIRSHRILRTTSPTLVHWEGLAFHADRNHLILLHRGSDEPTVTWQLPEPFGDPVVQLQTLMVIYPGTIPVIWQNALNAWSTHSLGTPRRSTVQFDWPPPTGQSSKLSPPWQVAPCLAQPNGTPLGYTWSVAIQHLTTAINTSDHAYPWEQEGVAVQGIPGEVISVPPQAPLDQNKESVMDTLFSTETFGTTTARSEAVAAIASAFLATHWIWGTHPSDDIQCGVDFGVGRPRVMCTTDHRLDLPSVVHMGEAHEAAPVITAPPGATLECISPRGDTDSRIDPGMRNLLGDSPREVAVNLLILLLTLQATCLTTVKDRATSRATWLTRFGSHVLSLTTSSDGVPPSLAYLARFRQDDHPGMEYATKTIISFFFQAYPGPASAGSLLPYWTHLVPSLADVSPSWPVQATELSLQAVLLLGLVGVEAPAWLTEPLRKQVAHALFLMIKSLIVSPDHKATAVDLFTQGFAFWQPHLDAPRVLRALVYYSSNGTTDHSTLRSPRETDAERTTSDTGREGHNAVHSGSLGFLPRHARQALLRLTTLHPALIASTFALDLLTSEYLKERKLALKVLGWLVQKRSSLLYPFLTRLVDQVVKSLDPRVPEARRAMMGAVTQCLQDLVRMYSNLAFHGASQRLAIGTQEGAVIITDLRTATHALVLEGAVNPAVAVGFSADGKLLACYVPVECRLIIWETTTSLLTMLASSLFASMKGRGRSHSHTYHHSSSSTDQQDGGRRTSPLAAHEYPTSSGLVTTSDANTPQTLFNHQPYKEFRVVTPTSPTVTGPLPSQTRLRSIRVEWREERTVCLQFGQSIFSFSV